MFSNGNSFAFGDKFMQTGEGMVGPASLQGERIVYEDMLSRLNAPIGCGAFV